ncbi:MAG: S8 family serine peptidase, partial [Verrucomicrobia bacterium]|nr:S8 family serine peptidase [Verrucomicrobiota bacterium]
ITDPDGGDKNAWDLSVGSTNVVVAILDSGIRYTHKDLERQIWHNPDEIPGNGIDDDGNGYVDDVFGVNVIVGSGDPWDDEGHGTHVAGIIGAAANNNYPHVGVAWEVKLMAIKSFDAEGGGFLSDEIEGVMYAVNEGARIINVSSGGYMYDDLELAVYDYANTNGVLVVCAVGNEGNDNDLTPFYPASYDLENIIAVTAIDRADKMPEWANYGRQSVDLAAPGVEIYSCYNESDTSYEVLDGTSMAAPFVSGTAALIFGAFPNADMLEARERILRSTVPVDDLKDRTVTGGRLNAYKALRATPDGILEITLDPRNNAPVLITTNLPVFVKVNDLFDITNATVVATLPEDLGTVTFKNDGEDPDETADDNIYSAYFDLTPYVNPPFDNTLTFDLDVKAPGAEDFTGSYTYIIVGPPENDDFADAAKVPALGAFGEDTIVATNNYATVEFNEPRHAGVSSIANTVWWSWSPKFSGPAIVDTAGTAFDAVLAVYTGTSFDDLKVVAAANDVDGKLQPYVEFTAQQGVTYWIAVAGVTADDFGGIRLRVEPGGAPDVYSPVVRVEGPQNGEIFTSSRINVFGEAFDPLPSAVGLREVLVRVNSGMPQSAKGTTEWSAKATLRPGPNQILVSALDYADNRSAPVKITVYYDPVEAPNDLFAVVLNPASEFYLTETNGMAKADNAAAAKEYGEPNHAGNEGGHSIWWTWKAPADGLLKMTTAGSDFDTLLAVYTGERVGELTLVGANDDAASTLRTSMLTIAVRGGVEYRIAVDGYGGASGKVNLNWIFTPAPVQSVTIVAADGGVTIPDPGEYTAAAGAKYTVQAIPDRYYQFVRWESDAPLPNDNPVMFVVDRPIRIQPVFAPIVFSDDFEAGDFSGLDWRFGGDAPWTITDATSALGEYAARSGAIGAGQSSSLILEGAFTEGTGSFEYRVSSEEGWDFLEFYVDGVRLERWSGEIDWVEYRFDLAAGEHTLEWRYVKDSRNSEGLDAAFIDNVKLPFKIEPDPSIPVLLSLQQLQSGFFAVRIQGQAGQTYVIEAADQVGGPWVPVSTNVANFGEAQFVDQDSLEKPVRFYRARTP